MTTVVEALLQHANSSPNKTALIVEGEHLSYRELAGRVLAVADFFSTIGVGAGKPVVLSADASAAFVYGYFACHLLGAICVPVDPQCSEGRLNYIVTKVGACSVFTEKGSRFEGIYCGKVSELLNFNETSIKEDKYHLPAMGQIADVIFTSGTTGDAKGVVLTHKAVSTAAKQINQFIGNGSDDTEIMPLPLSHSFGLGRLRCNMVMGATIILVPGFTNPALIYRALEEYSATGLASVPAGFSILLSVDAGRLAQYAEQLNYIEIGSSPMPIEHKKQLMELLPRTRICMHYGLTEASRSTFIEFHTDKDHLLSIGKPSPRVEINIMDDKGATCLANESGRIVVKGEHCMAGYWKNEDLTQKILANGWLITGDFGYKDSDGYVYLQSRETDMINVGGRKVSPVEIEELLNAHPLIADCACVGIPDPRGITGMAVKAFVIVSNASTEKLTPVRLASFLRGKIEPYKMPVAYQWIEKIPKTESGKIKRKELLDFC
jgi:long-chain acyl-CoA synthetase